LRAPLALYVPAVVYRARTCCPCCVGQYGQVALAGSVKLKQGSLGPRYTVVIWVSFCNKAADANCNAIACTKTCYELNPHPQHRIITSFLNVRHGKQPSSSRSTSNLKFTFLVGSRMHYCTCSLASGKTFVDIIRHPSACSNCSHCFGDHPAARRTKPQLDCCTPVSCKQTFFL